MQFLPVFHPGFPQLSHGAFLQMFTAVLLHYDELDSVRLVKRQKRHQLKVLLPDEAQILTD